VSSAEPISEKTLFWVYFGQIKEYYLATQMRDQVMRGNLEVDI